MRLPRRPSASRHPSRRSSGRRPRNGEVGEVPVPKGQKILLSIGAANRDPRRWDKPDRFDITRNAVGHLGFGSGIHGCVGQMLARLEIEVLLAEMARRIVRIERTGEIEYDLNNTTRGLSHLPVRVHA